jgi:WD40 repeat protein/mono/diheme cytochrome c family protein
MNAFFKLVGSSTGYWRSAKDILAAGVVICGLNTVVTTAQDAPVDSAKSVSFGDVKVVLRKHCGTCHNANEMRGGLDVMSQDAIITGSDSGSVIVPGNPEESLLYLVTTHESDPKMPPNSPKIPQRELAILRNWIAGLPSDSKPPAANDSEASVAGMNGPSDADIDSTSDNKVSMVESLSANNKANAAAVIIPIQELPAKAPIIASALHPDAAMMAMAVNRQIVLLNKETREFVGAIDFPLGEVHALVYSQDGRKLVVGGGEPGSSGGFVIYDLEGNIISQWSEEFDVIQTVAISPDGNLVAVGSPKRTVRVIQLSDGAEKFTVKKHTDWLTALAFSPDGLLLASGDRFGGLYLWNVATGEEFANLREHSGTVRGIQWSRTSDHLFSASEDGSVRRFDLQALSMDQEWNCDIGGITALTLTTPVIDDPKGASAIPLADRFSQGKLLVAGRLNKLKLYDLAGNVLWQENGPSNMILSLNMEADSQQVFATTAAGAVMCWLNDDHQLQPLVELPVSNSLNSQLIASISSQKPELVEMAIAEPVSPSDTVVVTPAPTSTESLSSLAESRKVLLETEEILKRFAVVTSKLEADLAFQENLRMRDQLRSRLASHRRMLQSLTEYLSDLGDTEESIAESSNASSSEALAQQLKAQIEKDLASVEGQLAELLKSIQSQGSLTNSASK